MAESQPTGLDKKGSLSVYDVPMGYTDMIAMREYMYSLEDRRMYSYCSSIPHDSKSNTNQECLNNKNCLHFMQALFEHHGLDFDYKLDLFGSNAGKMAFACHYDIPSRETTISFGSYYNDSFVKPLVIRLSLDQKADLQPNTLTTHQLLDQLHNNFGFISLCSDAFLIEPYKMKLIKKDGKLEGVTKSKLFEGHCPKIVYEISDIKDNSQLMRDPNQVIHCNKNEAIYVFKDGKEEAKIKPSDI